MALLTIERVLALRRTALFAAVPDHVLAGLARVVSEVSMDVDDVILADGDEGDSMLIVVSGRLRVDVGGHPVTELGAGASIGELSVLSPDRRSGTVVATDPGLLLRLERTVFDELMVDHPELARSVITMLVGMVRDRTGPRPP